MKLLVVAPLPPPVTGNSLAVQVFIDAIKDRHQVDTLNLSKKNFKNGLDSFDRIFEVFTILRQVRAKKRQADIVYFTIAESIAGNIKDLFVYLLLGSKLPDTIIHLHGGAGVRNIILKKRSVLGFLNRYFLKKLKGVIVLGDSHVDIFRDTVEKEKIFIVPNFAEDFLFLTDAGVGDKFSDLTKIRFLFLSNLIEGKGHLELVDAFLSLSEDEKHNIEIGFAGGFESPDLEGQFKQKIKGINGISYYGVVHGEEKKKLFAEAHVFCLPTYYAYEGQPISILEAYASGCVVLTTNHSGIRDVFADKVNGFEVEKKSVSSIADTIKAIAKHSENLLPIGLNNNREANAKYRTGTYNKALSEAVFKK